MSIVTWRKEFCPIPAKKMVDADLQQAIEHSLTKWEGLREPNLAKHGLRRSKYSSWAVIDDNTGISHTVASARQCALCAKFLAAKCAGCPLNKHGSNRSLQSEGCNSVYNQWTCKSDPEPMIQALEKALARTKRQAPLIHPGRIAEQPLGAFKTPLIWPYYTAPEVTPEEAKPEATGREALQALTVLEALEKARKVLSEIGTTGGDYGYFGYDHGNLVFDATQAEAALRFAAAKIGGSQ
jgi:hypothetical protein